jgi:hypothetical protein
MSDAGAPFLKFENRLDVAFDMPAAKGGMQDAAAARKALEDAIKRIPDGALQALRGFRLTLLA